MRRETAGTWMMIGACLVWGLSPLYYGLLTHLPPLEILAHRVVWSLVFFIGLLGYQGRLAAIRPLFSGRSLGWVCLAALCIWANWYTFVWAIAAERVRDASLGYFIFPLVSVALGAVFLAERLARLQWLAVGLAALAVILLTIGLGAAPWISLLLGATFGLYGLIKKRIAAGPVVSVTAEIMIAVPLALWVLALGQTGPGGDVSWRDLGLLVLSGPLTALPLALFSGATRRIRLATVGLLQYINPSLQFVCAAVILGEPMGLWHAISFPMIWVALAIYSLAALAADRNSASPSSTPVATDQNSRREPSANS